MMEAKVKQVQQSEMTAECWGVQVWGLKHCDTCEFHNIEDCGGQNIIKTGKNEKGFQVPLGKEVN